MKICRNKGALSPSHAGDKDLGAVMFTFVSFDLVVASTIVTDVFIIRIALGRGAWQSFREVRQRGYGLVGGCLVLAGSRNIDVPFVFQSQTFSSSCAPDATSLPHAAICSTG